ncbi:MAG: ABC transporter permease, partial [Exiguobacterium profundum]
MNQTNQTAKTVYLTTYWIWIALFVIAPLFLVVYYSFFDIDGNLSLENYQTFFTSTYLSMTLSSFWYAFLITFFSLLVGYPTAYLLTKTKHKQLWLLLILLPSWINL